MRLSSLSFTTGQWRNRSCDKHLSCSGRATHVAIERMEEDGNGGYVVAYVELHEEGEPQLHFVGTRPFQEDRREFWELAKLVCDFVKDVLPEAEKKT